jgi:hypothetical protein
MGDGRIFLQTSALLSLINTYRMIQDFGWTNLAGQYLQIIFVLNKNLNGDPVFTFAPL